MLGEGTEDLGASEYFSPLDRSRMEIDDPWKEVARSLVTARYYAMKKEGRGLRLQLYFIKTIRPNWNGCKSPELAIVANSRYRYTPLGRFEPSKCAV